MILLDYSAVAIANIAIAIKRDKALEHSELNEQFILHMILNSIRKAYKNLHDDFGEMVICCDAPSNWRQDIFPYYKYSRKKKHKNDDIDWDMIYHYVNYVKEVLQDFPYIIIEETHCEADDIIGVLARQATIQKIPTVIVSNDKDFIQCHSEYVCQWRPIEEAFVRHPDPKKFLLELIIRGDADDGIPNIKCPDNHFTLGKRQKAIYKKELNVWLNEDNYIWLDDTEWKDNFFRNRKLIDLTFVPENSAINIIIKYENNKNKKLKKSEMVKFFMKHKLRYLHERLNDFV